MKQWVYCAIMNDAINHVCRPIIMNKMHYILQNLINLIQKQILQIHIGPNNLVIEPYINASQTRLN